MKQAEKADDYQNGELPATRLFTTLGGMHPFLAATWLSYRTGLPIPQADPAALLPPMHAFAAPFARYLDLLVRTFDDAEVSARLEDSAVVQAGLQILNTRYLLAVHPGKGVLPLVSPAPSPVLVAAEIAGYPPLEELPSPAESQVEQLLSSTPAAQRLERLDELFPVVDLIRQTGVRFAGNRCDRILIAGLEGVRTLGTDPSAAVLSHRLWNQRVELRVHTSALCYARLAYACFPSLEVRLDGQPVVPMQTADGFMALQLPAGASRITLEARLSNLRRALLGLDALLLGLGAWVLVRERRNYS